MTEVWITRTAPDAADTAARVEALGLRARVAPLLEIQPTDAPPLEVPGSDVAFTSRNGVRFFRGSFDRTAWCVGEATARAARAAGFADVQTAGGDVAGLIAILQRDLARPVVHWAGAHVRGDLVGELVRAGHAAERVVAYRAHAVEAVAVEATDIVMVHSPRAADAYARLARGRARASVAISAAADAPLAADRALARYIADTPDESGMLAALTRAAATVEGS